MIYISLCQLTSCKFISCSLIFFDKFIFAGHVSMILGTLGLTLIISVQVKFEKGNKENFGPKLNCRWWISTFECSAI
jgi:hypothetical protein